MHKNHRGFSRVSICIVLVVIGALVGCTVWYIARSPDSQTTEATGSTTTKPTLVTYTDSSKTLSFKYPDTWSAIPYVRPGGDGPDQAEPDWTKTPQPITLQYKTNQKAEITIRGYSGVYTTVDKEIEASTKDKFNTYSKTTINGYTALKHVLDFVGPSDAEKYKDTSYILVHGDAKVEVKFRERYRNTMADHSSDFDVTKLTPDFDTIVQSIIFLN